MTKLSKGRRAAHHRGVFALLALTGACTGGTAIKPGDNQGGPGAGAPAGGGTNLAGMSSGGSAATPCQGSDVPVPKRLVRLSFNQISNAVRSLTNETLATTIATTYEIGDSEHRTFPPLASPREGSVFTDSNWAKGDKIAADVGKYIADNAATLTNCGATPSADCAKAFVLSFAERAFRRPLNDPEKANLAAVLSAVTAVSGTAAQQLQYGVYAVLESPYFLYRTELGQGATAPGPLAAYEVASQLSFFLTDAPPDLPLLEAAAQNALATPEQITLQVKRILALPAAQQNLQDAIFSYFGLYGLENVIINSPDFTEPVRNSMLHESELFLKNNLWAPKLTDMLTTRKSTINATLAPLYGAPVPTAGLDADGFGTVELPENRAGILTNLGFLSARSRPNQPSVVGRGLLVNAALLCAENPAFPSGLSAQIEAVSTMLADATERAKSDYRTTTPQCAVCHTRFDPYGLALGNFDGLGRYTAMDAQGRPIDAAVTLPPNAGGGQVTSATAMASQLASGGGFAACMAKNVLAYALAETPTDGDAGAALKLDGCATQAVTTGFAKSGQSFSDLVAQVAVSNTLGQRSAGQGAK